MEVVATIRRGDERGIAGILVVGRYRYLMPPALVRNAVGGLSDPLATGAGVGLVAERLRTSFEATLRHLNNLALIDDVDRQRINAERAG